MILQASIFILKTTVFMVGAVSLAYVMNTSSYLQAVMERIESELEDRVRLYDINDFICCLKEEYKSQFGDSDSDSDSDSDFDSSWDSEREREKNRIHLDSDWVSLE